MTKITEAIYSLYEVDSETIRARTRHPTASDGLASTCPRFAWYEANSPRIAQINPMLRRRLNYGSRHEEVILEELRQLGEKSGSEWKIKGVGYRVNLWGVPGRVDTLLKEGEHWKLLEIKTMNPTDFKLFCSEGLIAFPRYYEQFMFYMEACRRLPYKEEDRIETGVLLAENTWPLGELYAQELRIDEDCIIDMEEKKELLWDAIGGSQPPPRPFTQDSARCKYCWRHNECWNTLKTGEKKVRIEELDCSKEMLQLIGEYLKNQGIKKESEEKLDEVKRQIRNLLEKEKITEVIAEVGTGLEFKISLSEVTVPEAVRKGYSFVKLDVRSLA